MISFKSFLSRAGVPGFSCLAPAALLLAGCSSSGEDPSGIAEAAQAGHTANHARSGKLLDLPPELRPYPGVVTSSYYNGESTDWIRREHIMETSPDRFAGAPADGTGAEAKVVATSPPGTVTVASNALFPADESSQIAASLSMSNSSSMTGASARSGRVVAGDEDEVFRRAEASGFNLLRPSEQAVAIDAGNAFYADALAGE